MKLRKILLSIVTTLLLFTLVSCDKKENDNKFSPTSISTVLTTYKNNQDTKIEGVVYGVVKNGFYISDSNECGVFVVMGDNWKTNVNVGDKVQVKGQFSISNSFLQVKNVTSTKVVSSNNSLTLTSSELTINEINKLDSTTKTGSYAKLVTVTATVEKNTAGTTVLKDDEGKTVLVFNQSNDLINDYLTKRVKINVITHKYDETSNCWIVSFAGTSSDIVGAELTFETLVNKAKEHIESEVPTEFCGALTLPTSHPIFTSLTYTWEVEENEYVKVENNIVSVTIDKEDHKVKFYVTISYGSNNETLPYELTSKALTYQSISTLLANKPQTNMTMVSTSGIVVAITRNQSTSLRSFVLQDKDTLETIVVDFTNNKNAVIGNTSDTFKDVKLGDEIEINGSFDNGERCSIENVTRLEIKSSGNEIKYDVDNALEISDEESYNKLGKEYKNYVGKLVKIVNPFLNYSTSSTPADTNWVRFGWNNKSGNTGFGSTDDTHIFAFLIAAQNESLGTETWHTNYDIPFINDKNGAKQFNVTYYVYPVYYEDSTYLQFIIPSSECIELGVSEKINFELAGEIPSYVDKATTSKIELPNTHELAGTITWTSSNEDVISSNGTIGNVTKSTNVVLTAEYVYESMEIKTQFIVCVIPSEAESISAVLEKTEDIYVRVSGVVVSYVSDGNDVESRKGILLLEKETGKTLLVTNLAVFGGTNGAYVDEKGNAITIGDEITLTGKYSLNTSAIGSGPAQTGRNSVELAKDSKLEVTVKDVTFDYHLENAIVINNNEELKAFTENIQYGTILKLVGTKENPIYIGGSASKLPVNFKIFYTETGEPANDASAAKYDGTIYSLKSDVVSATWGENWYKECFGITNAFVGPNKTNSGVAITGEIYVAVAYRTGTYFQMCAVALDQWNVSREGKVSDVESLFKSIIPTTVEDGAQNFTLPTETIFTTGKITWVSSDSTLFDIEIMTAYAGTVDKEVNLNATFTLNDEEQSITLKVIVTGLTNSIEETEISALLKTGTNNTLQITEGIVVGYHSDGNTNGDERGIILMDSLTSELLLIDGVQKLTPSDKTFSHGTYYATDGTVLELGDKVKLFGKYLVSETRKSVVIIDDSYINVISKNNQITWGNPTVTITNNDEMTAFAANLQVGVLVKFVGTEDNPFCFGGSSNTASKINYKFFYNSEAKVNDDTKYNVKHGDVNGLLQFSFKGQVNVCSLGNNWWDTYFGLPNAFVGPKKDECLPYTYKGTIYAVVSSVTSTYLQMSFVNVSEISATMIQSGVIPTEA